MSNRYFCFPPIMFVKIEWRIGFSFWMDFMGERNRPTRNFILAMTCTGRKDQMVRTWARGTNPERCNNDLFSWTRQWLLLITFLVKVLNCTFCWSWNLDFFTNFEIHRDFVNRILYLIKTCSGPSLIDQFILYVRYTLKSEAAKGGKSIHFPY